MLSGLVSDTDWNEDDEIELAYKNLNLKRYHFSKKATVADITTTEKTEEEWSRYAEGQKALGLGGSLSTSSTDPQLKVENVKHQEMLFEVKQLEKWEGDVNRLIAELRKKGSVLSTKTSDSCRALSFCMLVFTVLQSLLFLILLDPCVRPRASEGCKSSCWPAESDA